MKIIGKCPHCNDPIYDFQEIEVIDGKKYHKGCYEIWERQKR